MELTNNFDLEFSIALIIAHKL